MADINIFDQTLKIIARDYADTFLQIAFPGKSIQLIGTLENIELALPMQWVDFLHLDFIHSSGVTHRINQTS